MQIDWQAIEARLTTQGPDGKPIPAITGNEPDGVLRQMAVRFADKSPADKPHSACPFCVLTGGNRGSLKSMAGDMTRMMLLGLFEMEHELREKYGHYHRVASGDPAAVTLPPLQRNHPRP